jgi:hypothetical protein
MTKSFFKSSTILLLGLIFIASAKTCLAVAPVMTYLGCDCCGLGDFMKVAVWLAEWILSISGSLALLFFVYGGFTFLISAGSSEKITKAKTILVNAVIGLVIVFASYMIIDFTMETLDYSMDGNRVWASLPPAPSGCAPTSSSSGN